VGKVVEVYKVGKAVERYKMGKRFDFKIGEGSLLMPVERLNECARRLGANPHAERALGVPASACTFGRWKSPFGQTRYVIAAALRRRNSSEALGPLSVSRPKVWAVNCSILRSL